MNDGVGRPQACDPPNALFHSRGGPGKIEMHDDLCVLEIHAFGKNVRRQQKGDGIVCFTSVGALRTRREARKQLAARNATARDLRAARGQHADARV